jgi:hypothetical protein
LQKAFGGRVTTLWCSTIGLLRTNADRAELSGKLRDEFLNIELGNSGNQWRTW